MAFNAKKHSDGLINQPYVMQLINNDNVKIYKITKYHGISVFRKFLLQLVYIKRNMTNYLFKRFFSSE